MPTPTADPSLTTLTEALRPLVGVLRKTSFTRRQRLAPILFQMLASELEVEVVVKDLDLTADGLRDKAESFVDHLHDLLGTEEHYEALNAASDLIEALDRVSYRELVNGGQATANR